MMRRRGGYEVRVGKLVYGVMCGQVGTGVTEHVMSAQRLATLTNTTAGEGSFTTVITSMFLLDWMYV